MQDHLMGYNNTYIIEVMECMWTKRYACSKLGYENIKCLHKELLQW